MKLKQCSVETLVTFQDGELPIGCQLGLQNVLQKNPLHYKQTVLKLLRLQNQLRVHFVFCLNEIICLYM